MLPNSSASKPYQPDSLPLENLDYRQLFALVGAANAELARYGGLLQGFGGRARSI